MNSTPQAPRSTFGTQTHRRKWWLFFVAIGLLCLLGWESRNYFSHRATLARLHRELDRRKDLQLSFRRDEVDRLLAGSPKKTAISTAGLRVDYFSWHGILYDFHLSVTCSDTDEVVGCDDLPMGFSNPMVEAPSQKTAQRSITENEVNAALATAEQILRRQGNCGDFRATLLSVSDGLPEVKISTVKGQLTWNSFNVPRRNRALFAFRFTLPSEKSFDLDYIHWVRAWDSAQTHEQWSDTYRMSGVFSERVLPKKDEQELLDETRSMDVLEDIQADGIDLPEKNVVRFGTRSLRAVSPQARFILYFFLNDDQLSQDFDCKTMLFLSEAGASPARHGAQEICKYVGLQVNTHQFPLASEGVSSTLSVLNRYLESGRYGPSAYGRILRPVLGALPEVTISTPGQALWQRIDFPDGPTAAVRVRIPSSISGRADFYAALAADQPVQFGWDCHDLPKGTFRARMVQNITLPAPLPPLPNQLMVCSCAENLLEPGQDVALWIRKREAAAQASGPVYITVTAVPHGATDWESEREVPHAHTHTRTCGTLLGVEIKPPTPEGSFVLGCHDRPITQLTFTPDSSRLISRDFLGEARIWEVESRRPAGKIKLWENDLVSDDVAIDSDSHTFAAMEHSALRRWNLDTQEAMETLVGPTDHEGTLSAIAYATQPDEVVLVSSRSISTGGKTSEEHGRFVTFGRSDNKWTSHPRDVNGSIQSLVHLPGVNLFAVGVCRTIEMNNATARNMTSVQLWPRDFTKPVQELPLGDDTLVTTDVVKVSSTSRGRRIAAICVGSGRLKVWDIGTWAELLSKKVDAQPLTVSLAQDGESVAVTCRGMNSVSLWNISKGTQQLAWKADDVAITHIAHSSDERWVATANTEGVIRLWKNSH